MAQEAKEEQGWWERVSAGYVSKGMNITASWMTGNDITVREPTLDLATNTTV